MRDNRLRGQASEEVFGPHQSKYYTFYMTSGERNKATSGNKTSISIFVVADFAKEKM